MNKYEKLMLVQSKLKAPKGQYNSFGKYNYRSCEDILESVKPLLVEVGAALTISDAIINIGERFYIEATAQFIDIETGEKVENKALAREDETKKGQDLAQVTGSVSSYARKYALNGLFCIDDTKDSDATNKGDAIEPHTAPQIKKGTNTPTNNKKATEGTLKCEKCGKEIKENVSIFSMAKYHKELCMDCQKLEK